MGKKRKPRILGKWYEQGPLSVARASGGRVAVRRHDADGEEETLYVPVASWQEFLEGVKNGEFTAPSDGTGS